MADPASQPPGSLPRASVLEALLREALVHAESPASRGEDRAVAEVARRLGPTPFSLEPVCTELVHAVLTVVLGLSPSHRAAFRPVAQTVASSLYDHPAARERLESLWNRLTQE